MMPIDVGTVLAGKYRLDSLLGRGGMGSVWRAHHLGLSAPVAVKLLEFATGSPESLARFHREAHAAASIRSPHVVQILDHGLDQTLGAPFIVMELMEGESLAQRLQRQGRLEPAETARILTHVARALSRAHEAGIVHRDLKPDNIFLVRNEEEEIAKVLDFGIAKSQAHSLAGDSGTRTGALMGTAYYMSPEQISGSKSVDLRTDLWALGVIAYECLTGTRPFVSDSIGGLTLRICVEPLPTPSQHASVPAGFDQWFARAVQRDPAQRFGSAREAVEALRAVCSAPHHGVPPFAPQPASGALGPALPVIANTAAPVSNSASHGFSVPHKRSAAAWISAMLGTLFVFTLLALGVALWWRSRSVQPAAELPEERFDAAAATGTTAPNGLQPSSAPSVAAQIADPTPPASSPSSAPQIVPSPAVKPARPASPSARTTAAPKPRATATARDVLDDRH